MHGVVITGIGAVSPVGNTAESSFAALMQGQSGVRRTSFELDERFDVRIAGEVRNANAEAVLGVKEARRHGRVTQLAVIAAREALDASDLASAGYDPTRVGSIIGVGMGGLETIYENSITLNTRGPTRVSPYGIPALIPNMAAGIISTLANAQGPSFCTASACASSAHAIGEAFRLVRLGAVDAMVCGGSEACVTPVAIAGFARMGALSKRNDAPEQASRPFAVDRDGFVMAEGAGMFVLEREDYARKRGARIFGRVCGYGASADAFHATQPSPDGRGAIGAMRGALESAGITPEQVDYINAHGTGTRYNDIVETAAIKSVFGSRALELPVSSTKSMTGHMLGGAGGFEAAVSILAILHSAIPPTINLDTPDPACDLDFVPLRGREQRLRYVLSNSFGFGGQNATLLLGAM
jgi:3-oxoacyl-[acyl-carrier-protein] synthase II